ncbi:hypothetical protein B7494_g2248 [Chlorociboria aeruginascens]|nr:hypothetical protein B7494_g2248 [Chlorociboria aeruginascens]
MCKPNNRDVRHPSNAKPNQNQKQEEDTLRAEFSLNWGTLYSYIISTFNCSPNTYVKEAWILLGLPLLCVLINTPSIIAKAEFFKSNLRGKWVPPLTEALEAEPYSAIYATEKNEAYAAKQEVHFKGDDIYNANEA